MRRSAFRLWLFTRTSELIYLEGNCGDAVAAPGRIATLAPFGVGLDAMTSSDAGDVPQAHFIITIMVDGGHRSVAIEVMTSR
jgi:hypothetical protein